MAYKRKYITSYFSNKKRRTYGRFRRRTTNTLKTKLFRRRRGTFKRRSFKSKRSYRYRQAAQKQKKTVTVHGPETRIARDTALHDFVKICVHANLKDAYDHTNNQEIKAYQILYDEFRIKKISVHYWIASTNVVTDKTHDSIVDMYNVYDPDALGQRFANAPADYTKVSGYKKRQMKPYQRYKVSLYPTWRTDLKSTNGSYVVASHSKSGRWMDMKYIGASGISSYNAQQVCFTNFDIDTTTWTDIKTQTYITYQFKGKRNDQAYE
ncbi:MAG: putative capsid protein [Cressdnaviricota sp.]|nr:MAG: putative capsid protein [Cressdnaviricota sp.]